jgi:hypothetical protein
MLFPANYPINPEDLVFIKMKPINIPLFRTGYPQLANRVAIESQGVTEIEVTPVLYERMTPEWYDGKAEAPRVHELLLYFDPEEFPTEDYGLIHGDISFESSIATSIGKTFSRSVFGEPEYTTIAEQNDDYVSMRYPIGNGLGFSQTLRQNIDEFALIESSPEVCEIRLISPLVAERYRQSVEPRRPDHLRPKPPKGLYTGMWIPLQ